MSQRAQILKHMREIGPITPLQALNSYGCMRLAARILELRELGHDIEVAECNLPNGKSVAQYSIKEKEVA